MNGGLTLALLAIRFDCWSAYARLDSDRYCIVRCFVYSPMHGIGLLTIPFCSTPDMPECQGLVLPEDFFPFPALASAFSGYLWLRADESYFGGKLHC